ncbi:hypothetical protein GCM10010430_18720 [Kitasatospora cystarginea]|uniref:Uncharacterized protein n=1 Tax=Kitasatospora cystarginea TaxID=58350 RepID=A0ABP5QJV4_9ACTN
MAGESGAEGDGGAAGDGDEAAALWSANCVWLVGRLSGMWPLSARGVASVAQSAPWPTGPDHPTHTGAWKARISSLRVRFVII